MAGDPEAFQSDAFQNDAFQTGVVVTTEWVSRWRRRPGVPLIDQEAWEEEGVIVPVMLDDFP